MTYDETNLITDIIYECNDEMTIFDGLWFNYDNAVVSVTGRVTQEFRYDHGDAFTPNEYQLISRHAELDTVTLSTEDGERDLTEEELNYIEKQIEL